MAKQRTPLLNESDLDRIKTALDDLGFQRQRMAVLEQCGHDCQQYRAVADEIERVLKNYQDFYHQERNLIAHHQLQGG